MNIRNTIVTGLLVGVATMATAQAAPHGNQRSHWNGGEPQYYDNSYHVTHKPAVVKHKQHRHKHRKFYRVKHGDNLHRISRKTGIGIRKLIRLNRHNLSPRNGHRLYVGQRLRLHR